MHTGFIAVFVLISTLICMVAGVFFVREMFSWAWGFLGINLFVVFFGILTPYHVHYRRYRRY